MQCHWCITNWQFKYSHAVAFCKCATKWTTGPQDHNNNNNNIPKEHQFTKRLFRQIFQSNCHSSCIYMYQNKQHYCATRHKLLGAFYHPPTLQFLCHLLLIFIILACKPQFRNTNHSQLFQGLLKDNYTIWFKMI